MRISVVINTYNRSASLAKTLEALEFLDYESFEVVVVNGPSTDATERILERYAGWIKAGRCPEVNLSMSRNIGIGLADGEVVAFLDDDAIPESDWLSALVRGYRHPQIGGAGGPALDHTGFAYQQKNGVCNRIGQPHFNLEGSLWAYQHPGADPFLYLIGTNSSFRKSCLLEIGGFDEEFEYYLDETDVCLRLIDRGYPLVIVDDALVHHKFLASHLRSTQRIVRHPFPIIKNKLYFALINGSTRYSREEILRDTQTFVEHFRLYHLPHLAEDEQEVFRQELEQAVEVGSRRGAEGRTRLGRFQPWNPEGPGFTPFPTRRPSGRRLTLCFLSQEYPPAIVGGIGHFTHDLATGLGQRGHEIHVITRGQDHSTIDFEEGVWVHRMVVGDESQPRFRSYATVNKNISYATTVHREVRRLAEHRAIDVVEAPIWDTEGVACLLDDDLTTVISLHTTFKVLADLHPSWNREPEARSLKALEAEVLRRAQAYHANSRAILKKIRRDYGIDTHAKTIGLIPHGLIDHAAETRRLRDDNRVRVLFVGRLEKRKGIDQLLQAIPSLCARHGELEFQIVGDNTILAESGFTYEAEFRAHVGSTLDDRVRFTGPLPDDALRQAYADADIFCAPSRYESFGLVLLEAMMFGVPVVCCRVGGMPEVAGEDCGILVPPNNVAALVEALSRLIADTDQRRALGARARQRFIEHFTRECMVTKAETFYHSLADGVFIPTSRRRTG